MSPIGRLLNRPDAALSRFSVLLLCVAAVSACKPAQTPAPAATPAPTVAPATEIQVEPDADTDNSDDTQALTGRFQDGESTLELAADGRYVQTLKVAGAEISAAGTWHPAGAGVIVLSPDGNPQAHVGFDVVSTDELRAQDGSRSFRRITGN